ncbi:MAG: hypothetical protein ACLSUW_03250 [Akkermansia sp.]
MNFPGFGKQEKRCGISLIDFQLERGENAITIMRAAFIPTLRNLLAADFYVTHST